MNGTMNKVILIGNLGDEVKMHQFDEMNSIGRFPIATSESYTSKETGEKVTQTEWHNIVVRNKLAEICGKYLKKGDKVYVEGKLKTRKWQDNTNQDRYTTEIIANEVVFLNTKSASSGEMPNQSFQQSNEKPSTQTPSSFSSSADEPDDLPF
ncbi:single-stranded DNA-binding protein [Moheibacter stercoris]|uniref:Single-stranded DNA-binding protein n=1 Tax=Moheibacter stercoris TaxID=1628251 RepID=A0ABV2LVC8_9FLAO